MERGAWTDERIEKKISAVDHAFERLQDDLGGVREELQAMRTEFTEELRGLRSDFSSLQGRLVQIGFGLVGVLISALIALIVALTT
jgi:tetrahydromethanopterin S-methyltransferase subunit B